jgi:hypothetical protein
MRISLFLGPMKVIHKIVSALCIGAMTCIVLNGCKSGEQQPDVSGIKIDMKTQRLDRDLAAIDTNHIGAGLQQLKTKYPDFLNFYLDTLMGFEIRGNYVDTAPGIKLGLKAFLTHKDYRGVFDTVMLHFPDTKKTDEALVKGFQYMKYYFPQYKVPQVIYLVSGLNNWGAFTYGDNTVGIGLDMFLGKEYPFYRSVGLPDYMNTHLRPAYMPVAAFSAIYTGMHPIVMDNRTLLDMMIQKGKEQYFINKVLPFVDDTTQLGYTQKQLEWCGQNEAMVYNFFIRENLLFATELGRVARYINDGPNSTGMPPESPGNIGSWLGLRIVMAYMQQHPGTTMEQLFAETDPQQFLAASKYKPK